MKPNKWCLLISVAGILMSSSAHASPLAAHSSTAIEPLAFNAIAPATGLGGSPLQFGAAAVSEGVGDARRAASAQFAELLARSTASGTNSATQPTKSDNSSAMLVLAGVMMVLMVIARRFSR